MKERLLTVCGQYNASDKKVPVLMLKGIWLEEAGFKIGERVVIVEEDGKLIIENKGKGYGKPYPEEKTAHKTKNSHPTKRRMGLN